MNVISSLLMPSVEAHALRAAVIAWGRKDSATVDGRPVLVTSGRDGRLRIWDEGDLGLARLGPVP